MSCVGQGGKNMFLSIKNLRMVEKGGNFATANGKRRGDTPGPGSEREH